MARLFLVCFGLLGVNFQARPAFAEWPEQSCSLRHRIPVTITAGPLGHDAEIRIDLTSADIPSEYVFSMAGDDARVFLADDLTPVNFVVAGWDEIARTASFYVRLPAIAAGASQTLYIYLGDESLPSGNNASAVFPDIGVRLHSRVSSADPISPADGLAAFAAATTDVDNSVRTTISGLNNRALGGTNGNYGWCVSAVLNVTAATEGTWGFRYGGDFGRGGHLYVRGQELEEQWNDDLWWANNYGNTNETLEGTIVLPEGWHRYEALGFEGCCDGPTGFQALSPAGGGWQDLSSSNFTLRASQCIATTVTVSKASAESCSTVLDAAKTLQMDASSPSDYFIPGAIVRYDLDVENPGQIVDAGTIALTDVFPPDVSLMTVGTGVFQFTDGAISSGLSFTYGGPTDAGDSVSFSTDGIDFTYIPASPFDDTVTHVRFSPSGVFNPNDSGDKPGFSIRILGRIN
ncbi:CCXG family PEP-CTERM protein [Litorimonas sp. WD9-15]|uniref:CCXG family PEP-CTERM protein n=1 Tax=Litorimonas sp. WD9-15 TaxID=3418716 RepID=UPI003CFBD754